MTQQSKDRPNNTATMLHSIAEELGCAPELVGVVKKELKLRSRKDILHATQERIASMAKADDAAPADDAPKTKKERKASLTLSQRRALLRLLDADDEGIVPGSDFKALPFERLVEAGYAEKPVEDNERGSIYILTESGRVRAAEINPGYRVWSAGESVAGDENRPVAGTHRQTKAEADAAKAAAEAAEAEAKADEPEPAVEEGETIPAEIGEPVELTA